MAAAQAAGRPGEEARKTLEPLLEVPVGPVFAAPGARHLKTLAEEVQTRDAGARHREGGSVADAPVGPSAGLALSAPPVPEGPGTNRGELPRGGPAPEEAAALRGGEAEHCELRVRVVVRPAAVAVSPVASFVLRLHQELGRMPDALGARPRTHELERAGDQPLGVDEAGLVVEDVLDPHGHGRVVVREARVLEREDREGRRPHCPVRCAVIPGAFRRLAADEEVLELPDAGFRRRVGDAVGRVRLTEGEHRRDQCAKQTEKGAASAAEFACGRRPRPDAAQLACGRRPRPDAAQLACGRRPRPDAAQLACGIRSACRRGHSGATSSSTLLTSASWSIPSARAR